MTSQVFISSYARDFPWLVYCLRSLKKFATSPSWLPPVICVDGSDRVGAEYLVSQEFPEATVHVLSGRPNQGFMRAQIGMMMADVMCPSADNIFLLGSDCLVFREFDPATYCDEHQRPAVLFTPRELMEAHAKEAMPWILGTDRVLGFHSPAEFMRRIPCVFPRAIFGPMRRHVESVHGREFEDYIYTEDARHHNTSEANILGAFAHRFMPDTCHWVDTGKEPVNVEGHWPGCIVQMWSHGGLERPTDSCSVLADGTCVHGMRPIDVIRRVLGE